MIKLDKINNLKSNSIKGKTPVDFDSQLKRLLTNIQKRAEYEISDTGFYRSINEHIAADKNCKFNCKAIALTVSQAEENAQHILEVSMLHPTMMVEIKRPLAAGKKQDILNFLKDKVSMKILQNTLKQMSEKLALQ